MYNMAAEQTKHMAEKRKSSYKLDQVFIRRLWECIKIFFPSCSHTSALMYFMLLGFYLAEQLVFYNTGLIPSQFYQILGERDFDSFKALVIQSTVLIALLSLINAIMQFLVGMLDKTWRDLLCQEIQKRYYTNRTYYEINVLDDDPLDNSDQRITIDIKHLCDKLSSISAKVIIKPLTIIYYTYECFITSGYIGPVSIYGYFIIGLIINRIVISPLVDLLVITEIREGDFRFNHMQLRTNAESVALYNGERTEQRKSTKLLQDILDILFKYLNFKFIVNFTTNLFNDLGVKMSYIVMSILIFSGKYDNLSAASLGSLISQNAFVCMYLMQCFTAMVALSNYIAEMAGYVHRVGEMLIRLKAINKRSMKNDRSLVTNSNTIFNKDKRIIAYDIKDVSYSVPLCNKQLIKDLTLMFCEGQNVLVTGYGKTSFSRILAGLWKPSSGTVDRYFEISTTGMMFLPQKPVLTHGSLAEQVIYPMDLESDYHGVCDDQLIQSLSDVGLSDLINRCNGLHTKVDWNWHHVLSPTEIQQVSLSRVLYHRPQFAFLDEPTKALRNEDARLFYMKCKQYGITYISTGQLESLRPFHDVCLELFPNAEWSLTNL